MTTAAEISNYNCPFCKASNEKGDTVCAGCGESTAAAMFTSLGSGSSPKDFKWPLFPYDCTIGSSTHNDVIIPSNRLDRVHCNVLYQNDHFYIEMLSEDRPVFLGSTPLKVGQSKRLLNNAIIRCGLDQLKITYMRLPEKKSDETEGEYRQVKKTFKANQAQAANPVAARMMLMLGYLREIHAANDVKTLLSSAVDSVLKITGLDRGYAFLVNYDGEGKMSLKEVVSRKVGGEDFFEQSYSISKSMLQRVMESSGAVIIDDADSKDVQSTVSMRDFNIKTITCVPITYFNHETQESSLQAILYADKLLSSTKLPSHSRATLQMISQLVSSNLEHCKYLQNMRSACTQYQAYLKNVAEDLTAMEHNLGIISNNLADCAPEDVPTLQEYFDAERSKLVSLAENIKGSAN